MNQNESEVSAFGTPSFPRKYFLSLTMAFLSYMMSQNCLWQLKNGLMACVFASSWVNTIPNCKAQQTETLIIRSLTTVVH